MNNFVPPFLMPTWGYGFVVDVLINSGVVFLFSLAVAYLLGCFSKNGLFR